MRTISMIFCIKLTIVSRSLVELTFPSPPILKFSSPLLILMGEGHDFETSGLKGQRNTKAFETALININSSTALNRLSWGVCWDCHRIDAMETGSIRLVQKRPFARVRFRLRNCLGNHYCNPSGNTFPPNCTPELYRARHSAQLQRGRFVCRCIRPQFVRPLGTPQEAYMNPL